jgi:SAM-dependent methyltransferase
MDTEGLNRALDDVRNLYTESLEEHGLDSKAVGWKDEQSHRLRFDKLAKVFLPDEEEATVADWGCGYGAMFPYLSNRLGPGLGSYTGYDISEQMIAAARAAHVDPRAQFVVGSDPEPVDYVVISGTFNVRFGASEEEWAAWVKDRLRQLTAVSRRGVAFNLLSSYVDWREPHLFYADPREFFDFCKRELSRFVSLLHDYPLYEWTIIVRL